MSVTFDVEVWRKRWRRAEGQLLVAVDATAGPELGVMMAAADEVVESINRRYRSLTLWNPMVSTAGPVTFIDRSRKWADVEQMLTEYAAALTAAGITGVLRDERPTPPGWDWRDAFHGVGMGVVLNGDLVVLENEVRPSRIVDPAALQAALAIARAWTGQIDGDWWIDDSMGVARVEPDRFDEVIDLIQARGAVDWGWQVAGVDSIRVVHVDYNGHLLASVKTRRGPVPWEADVTVMSELLQQLAPACQYGFATAEEYATPDWDGMITRQWGYADALAEAQYPLRIAWESHLVRNAYPVQLLGPGHVLPPLSDRWRVLALPEGRHLVSAVDVGPWAADQITKDLILTANAEFGPLIPPD